MSCTDAPTDTGTTAPSDAPSDAPTDTGASTDTGTPRGLGRPFAAQLTSTGLANLGDGLFATLVPLLALGLTTSPAQISLLSAATWLPWLLLGLAAGVLIDRVDRRRAQIAALTARAGLLATGAALGALDLVTMPVLVALTLAYGVTEVVADLGASSIVPDLVPRSSLAAANGRIVAVQQVANGFLGAPLAGALVVVGAGIGLGSAAALAALAAVVLLVGLRGSYRPTQDTGAGTGAGTEHARRRGLRASLSGALTEVREGLAFVAHHRIVRPLIITSSVLNFASTGYFAVYVLWVVGPTSHVGLTESQFPLLMLGFAAGAVAGSFLAPMLRNRLGELPAILTALTLNCLLMLAMIPIANGFALGATLAAIGVLNAAGNVISMALRQRLVPRELLGRVGGAARTLAYGLMPLGAIAGGLVAEHWGLVTTFIGAGVISLGACLYLAISVRGQVPQA